MLSSDWVVVVQREGLRSWSVKTAVACVLSRCQSPSSGGEVASTEPRGCQNFPRPGHHPRGAVRWSLVPCRRRVLFLNLASAVQAKAAKAVVVVEWFLRRMIKASGQSLIVESPGTCR